ncbi:polysaccharide biosynthesis protein [Bacillus sp. 165]|uniref:putative polysaccharide biosynthesis protein n=1 Tax=Bacillus sp. 165 TaxID=1529117 RepID=UPI001ADC99DB|nr:polysaccharide biosynthesis protein [Bacillus sp. 165]MBO9130884.1 polysaccharide biosynthesis protein [Bacillus sp. 165]
MSDSKFLRGTLILTGGTFFVKFLGMIYIFPFKELVGTSGGALYNYGYIPYTIFLSIATAGVPLAVSKFVSKYNAMGDYETSRRMFRSGMKLMALTGILAFLALFFSAPLFAAQMVGEKPIGHTAEEVTTVIRLVSFALIIVPSMSLIRGFFQGHHSMGPTTISQIIEQIVRIIVILAGSFVVIKVLGGTVAQAISISTFAAFVGAIGGLAILIWYWYTRRHHLDELLTQQKVEPSSITTLQMFKELFTYSAPYVFVGLAIPLFQQIDSLTFNRIMESIGQGKIAEHAFAVYTMWGHKLVMIPVSLATAFSLTLVPAITKSYTEKDENVLQKQIGQTLQVTTFLTLPAVVGMSVLAYPIYTAFYGQDQFGGEVLMWYAPVAILFSVFSVTAAILQGINKQKYAIVALLMGITLKIVLNIILIRMMGTVGAVLATGIGFLVAIAYTNRKIRQHAQFDFTLVRKRIFQISILVAAMAVVAKLTEWALSPVLSYEQGRFASIVIVALAAMIGAVVYVMLAVRTGVAQKILGTEFLSKIKGRLRRRAKVKGA